MRWVLLVLFFGTHASADAWIPGGAEDPRAFNTTWHPIQFDHHFQSLPLSGSVENEHIPWGDSYWPMQRGGMAYRWRPFQDENGEVGISGADRKKQFFDVHRYSREELLAMDPEKRRELVAELSPLEKYSILIGDYDYALVNKFSKSKDAYVSSWQGYCHAWAPVSLHYPEPVPVSAMNEDGIQIDFGSSDVKAVMISSYAERVKISFNSFLSGIGRRVGNVFKRIGGEKIEDRDATFIGKRCTKRFFYPLTKIRNGKEVFSDYGDPNGLQDSEYASYLEAFREKAIELHYTPDGGALPSDPEFVAKALANKDLPECNDVNAGAFHIVLGNQIGLMKEGFLIDKTRDVEVWNQPAFRYEAKVVEWGTPNEKSAPGTDRVVHLKTRLYFADDTDYGWAFWNPTLPALFGLGQDFLTEFDRYQKYLMHQGDLTEPLHYPEAVLDYAEYEYTLDLDQNGSILGGEWISFDRPDFLWLFRKAGFSGDYQKLNQIYRPIELPKRATSVTPF